MRIRSIKPEFWRSDDITALDWETRLLFVGLWSYVDDNGVGIDKLASITADLFAGDLEVDAPGTFARVSRGLRKLQEVGRVTRYEVDGKQYLHITNWGKHQRIDHPNKARYPVPTSENAEPLTLLPELSREPRETLATGTGEQGNRGTKKTSANRRLDKAPDHPLFPEFWASYPRREARKEASKKFSLIVRDGVNAQALVDGARRYAAYVSKERREREKIKLPPTWLNQGCWDDELDSVGPSVVPIGDPNDWLRRMWTDGDVAAIEKATGLQYPDPDLPMEVTTPDEAKQFHLKSRREWITANRDEILRRLTVEVAA
jgi:hypothetical protein